MEETKTKRSGETEVTSVSVSQHFRKLIDEYNISPTEAFRRGIAVTLYDLGVKDYQSEMNKERFKYVEKYIGALKKEESLNELFERILEFDKVMKSIPLMKEMVSIFEGNKEDIVQEVANTSNVNNG